MIVIVEREETEVIHLGTVTTITGFAVELNDEVTFAVDHRIVDGLLCTLDAFGELHCEVEPWQLVS